MTNYQRITAKVFGETASATGDEPEIAQFGSALAGTYVGTTDVETIQNLTAWSNGYIDCVTPEYQFPPLPEMTGVNKVITYQEAYLLQKGIPEWDSGTTYYTNDFCRVGKDLYYSLQDNNINNNPTNDDINWKKYGTENKILVDANVNGKNGYKVFREYDVSTGNYIGLWCEQWGFIEPSPAGANTINLNVTVTMANGDYNISALRQKTTAGGTFYDIYVQGTPTANGFVLNNHGGSEGLYWRISGYASESEE